MQVLFLVGSGTSGLVTDLTFSSAFLQQVVAYELEPACLAHFTCPKVGE